MKIIILNKIVSSSGKNVDYIPTFVNIESIDLFHCEYDLARTEGVSSTYIKTRTDWFWVKETPRQILEIIKEADNGGKN